MTGYRLFKKGYQAIVDLGPQVLRVESPEEEWGVFEPPPDYSGAGSFQAEAEPEPSIDRLRIHSAAAPLAVFARKAKAVNDWIYATLDTAAHEGDGPFLGKGDWVAALGRRLEATDALPDAQALPIAAACLTGRFDPSTLPVSVRLRVKKTLKVFEQSPMLSKPIGFYSESELLAQIFRHDRLLQQDFEAEVADVLTEALGAADLEASYRWHLRHAELTTGRLAWASLVDERRSEQDKVSIFPPSRAPETDLMKRLYANREIPDGFVLLEEVIRRVRSGDLDLTPSVEDGWYPRELYALSALVQAGSSRLEVGERYQGLLDELFKGLMSLTRETHVKQLEIPPVGLGIWDEEEDVRFEIGPRLRLEPVPGYYEGMADSYGWLQDALLGHWGRDALEQERIGTDGRVTSVSEQLADMASLFRGAAELSRQDLGFSSDEGLSSSGDRARALSFILNWRQDVDLVADCRMMVPLYFDEKRQRLRVSVLCGYLDRSVSVSFVERPRVQIVGPSGEPAEVPLTWHEAGFSTVYPVSFECDVKALLDRDELRALADAHRRPSALKQALEAL